MKAVTFHGRRDVRVDTVPDPAIEQSTDAVVRLTSSGICGSDEVEDLASHKLPLDEAPHAYEIFQRKQDGAIKILLQP